jgi:hypothetical protein
MSDLKCPRCSIPLAEHGSAAERYKAVEHVMRCMAQERNVSAIAIATGIAALGALAEKAKQS